MKTTEKIYPRIFDKSDLLTIPKAHPVSSASRGKGRSKYRVRLNIGYKSISGDPVLKSFYAPSAAEAKQRAYQYIQSMLDSQLQEKETNSLLVTAIEQYLYTERFGRKKPGTFDRLEEIFRHQIAPYIQGLRTENTTKADCAAIIDNNLQAEYSYSVLVKTYQLLKAFFGIIVTSILSCEIPCVIISFTAKSMCLHSRQNFVVQETLPWKNMRVEKV